MTDGNVVILMKFSSVAPPEVVILTTPSTASDENLFEMTTFLVKLNYIRPILSPSFMMTSTNGNIFRVTGPLWGESTGHWWIPLTKACDAEIWYSLIWTNGWANNRDAGDLRRHSAYYDVTVMFYFEQVPGLTDTPENPPSPNKCPKCCKSSTISNATLELCSSVSKTMCSASGKSFSNMWYNILII